MEQYVLCRRPPKAINFFINSAVHVLILLVILSAFFFVYASQLARDKFHSELEDTINENLTPMLQKIDTDGYIKKTLKEIQPNLQAAETYFNQDSPTTKNENRWLLVAVISTIAALIIIITIVIVILKVFCAKIPLGEILRENVILFTLVGATEICFFLFIAKNFIPTKPSLIMETVVSSLKKSFS